MTTFDSGRVILTLRCEAGRVASAEVVCQRPKVASVLRGKPAEQAIALVPLLFALCAQAQGLAARTALAAARGQATRPARDGAATCEAMREHLWHLLGESDRSLLARSRQAVGTPDFPLVLTDLLGLSLDQAFSLENEAELAGWSAGSPAFLARRFADAISQPEVPSDQSQPFRILPLLNAEGSLGLCARLDSAFADRPEWDGQAAETGAFARRAALGELTSLAARPLLARRLARLRELIAFASGGEAGLPGAYSGMTPAPGVGRAAVETARGLLLHEIALEGDTIADYTVVAPTEWNFHPAGLLGRWLKDIQFDDVDALKTLAGAAVTALDPCVTWNVSILEIDC